MMWVLISLILRVVVVHGACNLPTALNGNWTTSNFGTVTIQEASHQMSMTQTFTGASGTTTDFNCLLIDGNRYVMQSNNTVSVFSGTTSIYIYMCISFTQTSTNSYIYCLYSDAEAGLNNYRLTGLPTSTAVTTASQICTATPDAAEFNVMVNAAGSGYELGTIQCPSVLLGNFVFTYTRDGSTFCDTANATVNTCNNPSLSGIFANDTGCDTANPFYSNGGLLGCIASVENAAIETFYVSLYNGDANVDSTNTYRFSCAAITKNTNGTVYLSVSPTACVSGQTSTTAPSPGALMVMNPDSSSPEGTYFVDGYCSFCEKGAYSSSAGQTSCTLCPYGYTTSTIGSYSISQCNVFEATTTEDETTTDNKAMYIGVAVGIVLLILSLGIGFVVYRKIIAKSGCSIRPATQPTAHHLTLSM